MSKPKYCWDSCCFIAVLIGEDRAEDEVAGLREVMDEIDRGAAVLVTAATAYGEVLRGSDGSDVLDRFEGFLSRSNATVDQGGPTIMRRAGEIGLTTKAAGFKTALPDATFVAVALAHGCDALHTFDPDLLRLDGLPAVSGLRIRKPQSQQGSLALFQ